MTRTTRFLGRTMIHRDLFARVGIDVIAAKIPLAVAPMLCQCRELGWQRQEKDGGFSCIS